MNFATKLGSYQHRNNLWYVAIQRWGVVEGMWGRGGHLGHSPALGQQSSDLPAHGLPDFWLHLFVLVYTKYKIWTWGVDWLFFGKKDATTEPPWAEKLLQTIEATITKINCKPHFEMERHTGSGSCWPSWLWNEANMYLKQEALHPERTACPNTICVYIEICTDQTKSIWDALLKDQQLHMQLPQIIF